MLHKSKLIRKETKKEEKELKKENKFFIKFKEYIDKQARKQNK